MDDTINKSASKIQKASKNYMLKKRYYCTNDVEPFTLERISDIDQLYIFKITEGHHIHCVDIRELYKQYIRTEKLVNPFTRRKLEPHEVNRFLVVVNTLSNMGEDLGGPAHPVVGGAIQVAEHETVVVARQETPTEESMEESTEEPMECIVEDIEEPIYYNIIEPPRRCPQIKNGIQIVSVEIDQVPNSYKTGAIKLNSSSLTVINDNDNAKYIIYIMIVVFIIGFISFKFKDIKTLRIMNIKHL